MVASAVIYFVLAATEALSFPVRLVVMALVLVLGVAVAWAASRDTRDPGAAVGDQIDAAGDVTVERVDVERSGGNTRVGTRLKSGGTARVSDVRVAPSEDSE
jgi:hypothetical protein